MVGRRQLLGFLGIYTYSDPAELAGMVAPTARRRGIGSALLDAALALCRGEAIGRHCWSYRAGPQVAGPWPEPRRNA